ncbi:MAG: cell division protein FtsZ [Flavobacteriales bacterium]
MDNSIEFVLPKNNSSVIKVIGVGGGGSNAVNHMFNLGVKGVDFAVCNTDSQALDSSPVPNKIQLGVTLTKGLGAGANPEVGEKAAQESLEEIRDFLNMGTEMLFITAGMGGGTGTGAAPIIARTARESGVLSVGIVTIPFLFEGRTRMKQAQQGIEQMRQHVDTLIIINNDKIREIYGNVGFKAAFSKADEILATASKGISDVITQECLINIDLNDARTVLKDSGTAIMGTGIASGDSRSDEALKRAINSPLLNDNHINGAEKVLLLIMSGTDEITFDEIGHINDLLIDEIGVGADVDIIMGVGEDEGLGDSISVTVIATGFKADKKKVSESKKENVIVHVLEDTEPVLDPLKDSIKDIDPKASEEPKAEVQTELEFSDEDKSLNIELVTPVQEEVEVTKEEIPVVETPTIETQTIASSIIEEEPVKVVVPEPVKAKEIIEESTSVSDEVAELQAKQAKIEDDIRRAKELAHQKQVLENLENQQEQLSTSELLERAQRRRERLQKYNFQTSESQDIEGVENQPAYLRQGIKLNDNVPNADGEQISRFTLDTDEEEK